MLNLPSAYALLQKVYQYHNFSLKNNFKKQIFCTRYYIKKNLLNLPCKNTHPRDLSAADSRVFSLMLSRWYYSITVFAICVWETASSSNQSKKMTVTDCCSKKSWNAIREHSIWFKVFILDISVLSFFFFNAFLIFLIFLVLFPHVVRFS